MAGVSTVAVVVLNERGRELAAQLAGLGKGVEVFGLRTRVTRCDVHFDDIATTLRQLFVAGRPIVGVCAAGILVRKLAPVLCDKQTEPPVIAVCDDASAVVPLLGAHNGGNALATSIAALLGCNAAITTASDRHYGVALDAPPAGWRLANPEHYKAFVADLLAGSGCRIDGDAGWISNSSLPVGDRGELCIQVTEYTQPPSPKTLVYHPAVLALGVGCERGTDPDELRSLVLDTLSAQKLAPESVAGVFSVDLKSDEAAVHALGEDLGVLARFYDAASLERETPRLANPSERVFEEVGCHGVAEAAALAAAGDAGELLIVKRKSKRATCAVARAPAVFDPEQCGKRRGSLAVVGLGPGDPRWRTPEADAMVARATHLVGYRGYLDLLGEPDPAKHYCPYELGEEAQRVGAALALAGDGEAVALVCSGDAGIYAMASLVFETLERCDDPAWTRVSVTVVPGISALQAAAARVGAPLGHDFCAISLSDLLTPWSVIEQRLRAAAQGDFVVALYNPFSQRRRTHLSRAARILLSSRPAATPVAVARNLGRDGETVQLATLADLEGLEVDMLTIIIVGASQSRRMRMNDGTERMYTPRGYANKTKSDAAA